MSYKKITRLYLIHKPFKFKKGRFLRTELLDTELRVDMQRDNNELLVHKRVKHLDEPNLGKITRMKNFISSCQKELKSTSFEEKKAVIKKLDNSPALATPVHEDQLSKKELSFDISKKDIARIANQILAITTDPLFVTSLLKELDTELGDEIQKSNIPFRDNERPQFLITGQGNFIPGPPPDNYHPKKKGNILDTLLLKREQKNGINLKGAPKFVGAVDSDKANPLVASGYVFTEEKQISSILLHGSLSHRLMFDALCCAAKTGKLNLQYGDGKELTPQQLLELLVSTQYYHSESNLPPDSLWELTLDTVADTRMATKDIYNADDFNFSCRSPYVLNSLLLCFGKEVGLPNLECVLLDSHWKAAYEMVNRVKNTPGAEGIPESIIYTRCMEAFSTTGDSPGSLDVSFPFTLDESKAQSNPNYRPFDPTHPQPNIVQKEGSPRATGEYKSWKEFFDHKNLSATKSEIKIPQSIPDKAPITSDALFAINQSIKKNSPTELMAILDKFKPSSSRSILSLYNLAVTHRADDCLKVLVMYGLNINAVDEHEKKTALMIAKEKGDYQGMLMLVKAGAKEYLPKPSYSIATLLANLGINRSAPPSLAIQAIKQLGKGIKNADDNRLVKEMEYQLSEKSSKQQLAIILLDNVERNINKLSPAMRNQIDSTIDFLLGEQELSALNDPPKI